MGQLSMRLNDPKPTKLHKNVAKPPSTLSTRSHCQAREDFTRIKWKDMHDRVKVHETSMLDLYLVRFPCLMANKMSKLGISQETGVRISRSHCQASSLWPHAKNTNTIWPKQIKIRWTKIIRKVPDLSMLLSRGEIYTTHWCFDVLSKILAFNNRNEIESNYQ
jgi:hypothetical protein